MKRCARCQAAILFTEMVMRARDLVFHVHCFTCAVCNSTFSKGDQFGLKDSSVLCQIHYELAVSEQQQSPSPATFPGGGGGGGTYPPPFPSPEFHPHHHPPAATPVCPDGAVGTKVPYFNGSTTGATRQKGRPRKRKPKDLETMTANLGTWTTLYALSFCLCVSFFSSLADYFLSFVIYFSLSLLPSSPFHFLSHSLHGAESFLRILILAQLVNKFSAFYGTRRFITVFTRVPYFAFFANLLLLPLS